LEFRLASGNAGTGRASEAHLNMDVNMRRLPDGLLNYPLQALCGIRIRRTVALSYVKATERLLADKQNIILRTTGILTHINTPTSNSKEISVKMLFFRST
jgi:hypothetical protein